MAVEELDMIEKDETPILLPNKFCLVEMIPAKLSYLLFMSMVGTYAHFTNVFLRDIGLTASEAGFISGIALAAFCMCSPLWGYLADYTGRHVLVYVLLSVANICFLFPIPFVAMVISPKQDGNSTTRSINATMWVDATLSSVRIPSSNPIPNLVQFSSPTSNHVPFSNPLFFAMLFIEIVAKACVSPLHSMIDAAVMNVIELRQPTATFGEQRVYGAIGFGAGSFFTGLAVDHSKEFFKRVGLSQYAAMFCMFLPVALVTLLVTLCLLKQMDIRVEKKDGTPKLSNRKLLFATFSNFTNIIFLITCFVAGFSNMVLASFLFMLMKDEMNAPQTLMGMATLTQSLVQVFIFPFAEKIINVIGGPMKSIEIAVFSYAIRYLINSFIENPWLLLITQTFHSLGFSLFWAAGVMVTQQIAPKEIYVTMFTVVSSLHVGVGGIVANMLGGVVYGRFGGKVLFRAMAVLCGVWTLVLVFCFHGNGLLQYVMGRKSGKRKVHPAGTIY